MDVMALSKLEDRSIQTSIALTNFNEEQKSNLKLSEGRMPAKRKRNSSRLSVCSKNLLTEC